MASPLVRRLRIGAAIRDLRRTAGISSDQLARTATLSQSDISRLETGARKPDITKVMACLDALGVAEDSDLWRTLLRVASDANRRGWWEGPGFTKISRRQALCADVESGTVWIGLYHNALIPGLLQTADYVRARDAALEVEGGPVDPVHGTARLRRQAEIIQPGGPRLEVLLEEVVIRRLVVTPAVMAQQLRHLIDLTQRYDQISIRVLPVECSFLHGQVPRTPLALHRFADSDDGIALLMEIVNDDLLLYDQDEVAQYVHLFDRMRDVALSDADSAALIDQTAATLELAASRKGPHDD